MYYSSNSMALNQFPIWPSIDSHKVKSVIEYVMGELYGKLYNSSVPELDYESSSVGAVCDKIEEFERIYSMTYANVNRIEKNFIKANSALDDISELCNDWNNNGAKAFEKSLIDRCRGILDQLVAEPFVCPTACGSIQFEYEKENGDYLEFEIYEDRIEVFLDTVNGEEEYNIQGSLAINKMKQLVVDFYG